MLGYLVFVLFALLDQGYEALEFCTIAKAVFKSLYPLLHVLFLGIFEPIKMIFNFFVHVHLSNTQWVMAAISVVG